MSRIFKCSRHGQWLVDYVRLVRAVSREVRWIILPYFTCPQPGCGYVKSNKWRKAWLADPNEVIVLQHLKDGVPTELLSELVQLIKNQKRPQNQKRALGDYLRKKWFEKCGESQ